MKKETPELLIWLADAIVVGFFEYVFTEVHLYENLKKSLFPSNLNADQTQTLLRIIQITILLIIAVIGYFLIQKIWSDKKIYDGSERVRRKNLDVELRGKGNVRRDAEGAPITIEGKGQLHYIKEEGILDIVRENKEGRFEIYLERYSVDEGVFDKLPKNRSSNNGERRLRVSFEARAIRGHHELEIVFSSLPNHIWIAHEKFNVKDKDWKTFRTILSVATWEDCKLRIDNQEVSDMQASIQIRNLILEETKPEPAKKEQRRKWIFILIALSVVLMGLFTYSVTHPRKDDIGKLSNDTIGKSIPISQHNEVSAKTNCYILFYDKNGLPIGENVKASIFPREFKNNPAYEKKFTYEMMGGKYISLLPGSYTIRGTFGNISYKKDIEISNEMKDVPIQITLDTVLTYE